MSDPEEPTNRYRYRLAFRKGSPVRFLSHHDLMRAFERALRRAALPLRMTQGFNPHPRFALLWPTAVGMTSQEDFLECELSEPVEPSLILERLSAALHPELRPFRAEPLPTIRATPVVSVQYEAEPPEGRSVDREQFRRALGCVQWTITRQAGPRNAGPDRSQERPKTIDIRPFVLSLDEADGKLQIHLKVTSAGNVRPTEVLLALGYDLQEAKAWRIDRRKVHLAKAS